MTRRTAAPGWRGAATRLRSMAADARAQAGYFLASVGPADSELGIAGALAAAQEMLDRADRYDRAADLALEQLGEGGS